MGTANMEYVFEFGGGGGASVHKIRKRMLKLAAQRVEDNPPPEAVKIVRFPIALVFLRGDREGSGAAIAGAARSGMEYWGVASGESFDLFFAGWEIRQSVMRFDPLVFHEHQLEVERGSLWRYSGESDMLLLNFEYDLQEKKWFT